MTAEGSPSLSASRAVTGAKSRGRGQVPALALQVTSPLGPSVSVVNGAGQAWGGPRGFLVTAVLTGTELLPGLSQVRPAGQGPPFPAWALPVSMNSLQGMARTKQGAPGTKLEEMQREMKHSQRIFVRVRIKMGKISQTLLLPLNFFHSLAKACISLNSVI